MTTTETRYFVVPAPGHYSDRARVLSSHGTIAAARKAAGPGYVVREGDLRKGARQWQEDSSLERWFPLTAERLKEAEATLTEVRQSRDYFMRRLDERDAEVARLRSRVRVEAEDVAGVTKAHVEAWLRVRAGWYIQGGHWRHTAFPGRSLSTFGDDAGSLAWIINSIADHESRPTTGRVGALDILDEMAPASPAIGERVEG